ncbi:flavin monoamine oxidase family protein [Halalkalibacter alkalisediminis]|uniref:Flavin monoamine oxidase family protein n=1 Tax=Halalkalibacter alkalisediminis TaxID=935616 RepID=A0ABV6NNT8_9BACI|nr:FAD-dependent oxidoreductase [Halalkalibacter alkalisediminis]
MGVKEIDVVIIGAGLSGLVSALELKKHKIPFVLLEARSRAGGRIHTIESGEGVPVDLGAQWISPYHERVKKLVRDYGLRLVSTYREGKTIYDIDGVIEKTEKAWPSMSLFEQVDICHFKRELNKRSKKINSTQPWESQLARELDKKTVEEFLELHTYTPLAKSFYRLLLEEALCSKLYEVSTLDLLWCIRGAGSIERLLTAEDLWIEEGAECLVRKISESLNEQIRYDSPVKTITYEDNQAVVFTDQQTWKAKKVIVAMPPNLLTRIHFDPPLPANRAQLNERAGLPSVIKIIFVYERPFWREQGLSGMVYSNQGLVKLTIDSSSPKSKNGVLTALVTGDSARKLSEKSSEMRKKEERENLVRFFGKEALQTREIHEKDWSAEEWTRGGYGTHFSAGIISQFGQTILPPIGPLHWAGTETATEWRMYMEGAVQSGERAATEVIRYFKR